MAYVNDARQNKWWVFIQGQMDAGQAAHLKSILVLPSWSFKINPQWSKIERARHDGSRRPTGLMDRRRCAIATRLSSDWRDWDKIPVGQLCRRLACDALSRSRQGFADSLPCSPSIQFSEVLPCPASYRTQSSRSKTVKPGAADNTDQKSQLFNRTKQAFAYNVQIFGFVFKSDCWAITALST